MGELGELAAQLSLNTAEIESALILRSIRSRQWDLACEVASALPKEI